MNMTQNKITDFIADCEARDGEVEEEYEQKDKINLSRGEIHSLNVEAVITGENQFGEYIGLQTNEHIVFFGGYEAADVKHAIGKTESPFTIEVLRTQMPSQKNEGRSFNKVYAKLV